MSKNKENLEEHTERTRLSAAVSSGRVAASWSSAGWI